MFPSQQDLSVQMGRGLNSGVGIPIGEFPFIDASQ
jgi:hypothetical protein